MRLSSELRVEQYAQLVNGRDERNGKSNSEEDADFSTEGDLLGTVGGPVKGGGL